MTKWISLAAAAAVAAAWGRLLGEKGGKLLNLNKRRSKLIFFQGIQGKERERYGARVSTFSPRSLKLETIDVLLPQRAETSESFSINQ